MDRRKRSSIRRRSARRSAMSLNEIVIIQTGACGIILLFFLIAGLIDIPLTNRLKAGFKSAITKDVSQNELEKSGDALMDAGNGLKNFVLKTLGFQQNDSTKNNADDEPAQSVFNPDSSTLRIDEDMLEKIYSSPDFIAYQEEEGEKKAQAPLD